MSRRTDSLHTLLQVRFPALSNNCWTTCIDAHHLPLPGLADCNMDMQLMQVDASHMLKGTLYAANASTVPVSGLLILLDDVPSDVSAHEQERLPW